MPQLSSERYFMNCVNSDGTPWEDSAGETHSLYVIIDDSGKVTQYKAKTISKEQYSKYLKNMNDDMTEVVREFNRMNHASEVSARTTFIGIGFSIN